MNIIDSLILAMPYMQEIVRDDVTISLQDREKFLYSIPAKNLSSGKIKSGDMLEEEYKNFRVLKNGREKNVIHLPAYRDTAPVDVVFLPVKDEQKKIVAVLCIAYSMENQTMLGNLIEKTGEITQKMIENVQHVAAHSEELSATSEQVLNYSKQVVHNSEQVSEVTNFIRDISTQTNLLGLNSSIEAARVGNSGAGFGVIAQEIRRLSDDTKGATVRIIDSLDTVKQSIKQMETNFTEITSSSHEQAKLVNNFSEVIDQLHKTTDQLKIFMNKINSHEK